MRSLLVPGLALSALLLGGCAAFSDSTEEGDGLQIAAGFYPLEYVADRVAGDHGEVTNLTVAGQDPHHTELGVQETDTVSGADLVLYAEELQPAVDEAVAQVATGRTMEATATLELQPVQEDEGHGHDHEEHAEDGHNGEEAAGDHDHAAGEPDPHFWHDPMLMADVGDTLAAELADLDPANAARYHANAEDLREDLTALDREFTTGLADCERSTVVVAHDAFGYLTKYGLHFDAVAGIDPDQEPTPADLAELGEIIRSEGLTTVFAERLASPRLVETLADDLGVEVDVLDPLEGLTEEHADSDYLDLMRENLGALQEANGCQ